MNEMQMNQELAESICSSGKWNGRQFQPGEAVALLDGKVVAVTASLDSALGALRALEPDPRRGMVCEVAAPVVDVIRGAQTWPLSTFRALSRATCSKSCL